MHNISLLLASGALVLSTVAWPVHAQAEVPLSEEKHINQSLLSAAVAAIIANRCEAISVRRFTAILKAWQLKDYALKRGYSNEEIDAFVESKEEQGRIRKAANRYLLGQGAVADEAVSFCTVGRAEIENKTLAGQLIRAN